MSDDRYWLFDGQDATGPFTADELKSQPGFGPESLICPDGAESADLWRSARYYLIRPPASKPETARSPAAVAPEPVKAELPPVVAPSAPGPASSFPTTAVASVAGLLLIGSALAYLAKHRPKSQPLAAAPAAAPATTQPGTEPAAPAPPALNQEAVDFVRAFPAQSLGVRFPPSALEIFSARKWQPAKTVGEALERKALLALAQSAAQTLQKQGHTPEAGELEIKRGKDRWLAYARRFLAANFSLDWTTEPLGGDLFRVTAQARYRREGPTETHAFEADLSRRTLKPLGLDAWFDVDPRGCARWGDKNLRLGEIVDAQRVLAAAPVYGLPLPHHKIGKKPPPRVAAAPKPAKAAAGPPAEESDYPDEPDAGPLDSATPAPAPAEHAAAKPQMAPPAPAEPAPEETKPARRPKPGDIDVSALPGAAPPPRGDAPAKPAPMAKPAEQPAEPAADSSEKPKSATDMSVDELEQYLNRGDGDKK